MYEDFDLRFHFRDGILKENETTRYDFRKKLDLGTPLRGAAENAINNVVM